MMDGEPQQHIRKRYAVGERIYGQLTGSAWPTADKLRQNGWFPLRAGLPIADNPRIGRELLIVREGGVAFLVEAL
jgi:hypothetical protein